MTVCKVIFRWQLVVNRKVVGSPKVTGHIYKQKRPTEGESCLWQVARKSFRFRTCSKYESFEAAECGWAQINEPPEGVGTAGGSFMAQNTFKPKLHPSTHPSEASKSKTP